MTLTSLPLLLLPLGATMETLLTDLERTILETKLAAVTGVATSLAAACCAIALVGIGARYLSGMQFDLWQFARPIVIFLLVSNFSTLVLGPIRGIAGVYNVRMAEAVGASTEEFKALFRERATQMCQEEFGGGEEDGEELTEDGDGWSALRFLKRVGSRVTRSFYRINARINLSSAIVLSGVMFFLLNMLLSVMVIVANLYLIIMALIGPFTFALSILTSYSSGIKLWIERYIQFTFWQPLLYTFMYIGTQVMILGNQSVSWGGFWTWCFMCAAIFTIIRQVPGIASLIIESAGTEALARELSGTGGQLLRKASSLIR